MPENKSEPVDLLSDDIPPSYDTTTATATTTDTTTTAPSSTPKPTLPRPPPLDLPALAHLRDRRVILASSSPRRRQILSHLGLTRLESIPSTAPEDFPKTLTPWDYVLQTATRKAQTVYASALDHATLGDPALVIAADTVVADTHNLTAGNEGIILEKPRSEAAHVTMLRRLRDARVHKVYTAVAVIAPLQSARDPGYAIETHVEETTVRFHPRISDELLLAYVRTREGADKAGGYALQGLGSILVEGIEGSWDNVVGLPLRATLEVVEKVLARADDEDRLPEGMGGSEPEDSE